MSDPSCHHLTCCVPLPAALVDLNERALALRTGGMRDEEDGASGPYGEPGMGGGRVMPSLPLSICCQSLSQSLCVCCICAGGVLVSDSRRSPAQGIDADRQSDCIRRSHRSSHELGHDLLMCRVAAGAAAGDAATCRCRATAKAGAAAGADAAAAAAAASRATTAT